MFDIGATELLLIVIVAVVVIGPKDLPLALRTAGRWLGKMRRISNHFRSGLDTMIREAEMEEMEQKWREQNERIMREHPVGAPPEMEPTGALPARKVKAPDTDPAPRPVPTTDQAPDQAEAHAPALHTAGVVHNSAPSPAAEASGDPQLPLGEPPKP